MITGSPFDYNGISGLAIVDNELFVTVYESAYLYVYDLKDFHSTKTRTKLRDAKNPYDLGYCSKSKCLYVMDTWLTKILKVDLSGCQKIMWATKGYGCISITHDCNVLMADSKGNKIIEYTPDGKIHLEIVSKEFVHPKHALKLADGRYLISQGRWRDVLPKLCVVDKSGNIQMSYGPRFFTPTYLAIDSAGSIFAVDCRQFRVLLFSSDFKFIREIISSKRNYSLVSNDWEMDDWEMDYFEMEDWTMHSWGLKCPPRMVFDEANGLLILSINGQRLGDEGALVFRIA